MKIDLLFAGFPGKMEQGYMEWSSSVLVRTGKINLLFDTAGAVRRGYVVPRLKSFGITPDDIDIVVLSHFHEDHAGNIDYFKNATVFLHEKEASWLESDPDSWAVPKALYPILVKSGRLSRVKGDDEILPSISTLLVPGHTPGSMALVLRNTEFGTVVLAGDAVKNMSELASGSVNMTLDSQVSNASIQKVQRIADVVIPGHDRILQLSRDKVTALTEAHEKIILPEGMCGADGRAYIDLVVEKSQMERTVLP